MERAEKTEPQGSYANPVGLDSVLSKLSCPLRGDDPREFPQRKHCGNQRAREASGSLPLTSGQEDKDASGSTQQILRTAWAWRTEEAGQRGTAGWTLEWSLRKELGWRVPNGAWKELGLGYSGSLALVTICLKFKLDMANSI